jgi:hypothetical protein
LYVDVRALSIENLFEMWSECFHVFSVIFSEFAGWRAHLHTGAGDMVSGGACLDCSEIAFHASFGALWKPPEVAFCATSSVHAFLAHLTVVRSSYRAILSLSLSWAFEYSSYALLRYDPIILLQSNPALPVRLVRITVLIA